jgi:ubiquinone/menaquinone biosynthesis C-methylase UbiE
LTTPPVERVDVVGRPRTIEELEHVARYRWASSRVSGSVLDVACGTGYGSELLATDHDVTGIDRDEGAIRTAAKRAAARFSAAEVPPIPEPSASFDAIVSFETIEHVTADRELLGEFRRVLKPGGTLLLSSPNAAATLGASAAANPWHVREYSLGELRTLVTEVGGFGSVLVFAQRHAPRRSALRRIAVAAWRLGVARDPGGAVARRVYGNLEVEPWDGVREPAYWILACS